MFQWLMRAIAPAEPSHKASDNGEAKSAWNEKAHNKQLTRLVDKSRADAIEACDKMSQDRYDDIDDQIEKHRALQLKIRAFKQKKSACEG